MKRRVRVSPTEQQLVTGFQVASLLLGYPDGELLRRLPLLRRGAGTLPEVAARPLLRFIDHLEESDLERVTVEHVETFDLERHCCPYLTYYSHGDTRRRGMAILAFVHAYRSAGWEVGGDELADHLAVVLEFCARGDLRTGLRLLTRHRAAIELLRAGLEERRSPYVDVLDGVRALLPEPAPADLEAALELARTGPPAEEVGLEPSAPPDYMGGARR